MSRENGPSASGSVAAQRPFSAISPLARVLSQMSCKSSNSKSSLARGLDLVNVRTVRNLLDYPE